MKAAVWNQCGNKYGNSALWQLTRGLLSFLLCITSCCLYRRQFQFRRDQCQLLCKFELCISSLMADSGRSASQLIMQRCHFKNVIHATWLLITRSNTFCLLFFEDYTLAGLKLLEKDYDLISRGALCFFFFFEGHTTRRLLTLYYGKQFEQLIKKKTTISTILSIC